MGRIRGSIIQYEFGKPSSITNISLLADVNVLWLVLECPKWTTM